jgi:hypothetical protein
MGSYSSQVERLLRKAPSRLPLSRSELPAASGAGALEPAIPSAVFSNARKPEAAVAGLLLRLGCWDKAHAVAQDVSGADGSYWHGILHRMEPDSFNAGYWFRRVGAHEIFPELLQHAAAILRASGPSHWRLRSAWDPFLFIDWCDEARQKCGLAKAAAIEIQMTEWQLLFDWCAAPLGA